MDSTLVSWLGQISSAFFAWSVGLFLVINGAAVVLFMITRDRSAVNRWTGRILAVDLLLIGTGVGVPVVASMAKLTVVSLSSSFGGSGIAAEMSANPNATELTPGRR